MMELKKIATLLTLIYSAASLDFPPSLQKCKRSSSDDCLKSAIQDALPKLANGLPQFNFPPIKPVNIPSLTIGEGVKGAVKVVQNYKDVNIYGIAEAKVESVKVKATPTSYDLQLDAFLKELRLKADYDFNGQILVLPIVGKGKCDIVLSDLKVSVELPAKTLEKKGKTYLQPHDVKLTLKPGKVHFGFDNLFNGDEKLGGEVLKLMNDNWSDVFEDIRSGYEEALSIVIMNYATQLYTKIPYEELSPP